MKKTLTALVVDDQKFIRQILDRMVSGAGYRVRQASDGLDALCQLNEHEFDVVISDIKMPNLDGLGLLKQIREKHPQVPVVLMSGFTGDYTRAEIMEAGADQYLAKPFKSDEVSATLALVRRALENSH